MLTILIGDEKKIVAPLLGKLYISPHSTEEKIREAYEEITIAVDDKLVTDTTGRNALNKIHVSLGKIVANMGAGADAELQSQAESRRASRSVSVAGTSVISSVECGRAGTEERTVIQEPKIKEEEEESDATALQDAYETGDDDDDEATVKVVPPQEDTTMDDMTTTSEDGA